MDGDDWPKLPGVSIEHGDQAGKNGNFRAEDVVLIEFGQTRDVAEEVRNRGEWHHVVAVFDAPPAQHHRTAGAGPVAPFARQP